MSGLQKYPECDLCTSTECNDDKVSQIFEDVEFTKQFLLNMKKGNVKYEEIANDCYLMAEVISGKTDPLDISEFAFCIYVSLAQLVELDPQQRMEVAVVFKELLDKISGNIGTGRKVTKKGSVNEEVETADDTRSFLSHLDDEIADLEATSAQFYTTPATAPPATAATAGITVAKPAPGSRQQATPAKGLQPVIGKLGAPVSGGIKLPSTRPIGGKGAAESETGTRENPIKLTPEMLQGAITSKDINKINKGIKIQRTKITSFTPPVARPPPLKIDDSRVQSSAIPFLNMGLDAVPAGIPEPATAPRKQPEPAARKATSPQKKASGENLPALDFGLSLEPAKKAKKMELPEIHLDDEETPEPVVVPRKPPAGDEFSLDLADPFELQKDAITKEKSEAETPLKLCHNCKTLNKITNKVCTRCGFFF